MRKILWLSLLIISVGIVRLSISHQELPRTTSSTIETLPKKEVQYKFYTLESSVVHTLLIPADSRFLVMPAVSQKLSTLENFALKYQAVAVINGGFFDPRNQESTSYVVQQGVLVADPRQNERLMNNPKLAPYLKKIFDRTEFRRYQCGSTIHYDLAFHRELIPKDCELVDVLGGGPRLLPKNTAVAEGFLDVDNGLVIRDTLSSRQLNARSAVGITRDGSVLLGMVAQKPLASQTSGMSLAALADFMKTLGVEKAMNLDGGSSSSFYYKGKIFYGKVDEQGTPLRRPVLSVLLVKD